MLPPRAVSTAVVWEPWGDAAFGHAPADQPRTESDITAAVFASFDPIHGGFGIEPKFPLTAPVQLALDLWQTTGDTRYEAIAISTLDAMGWGPLYDGVDGG